MKMWHLMEYCALQTDPTVDGEYACEVYFGWKLLEWRDGKWYHPQSGHWPLEVEQWVGPLPTRISKYAPAAREFDL